MVPANGKSAQVVIPSFEKVSALKFKKHERFIANLDNVFALCFALFCFEICFRAQVILSGVKIVKVPLRRNFSNSLFLHFLNL